MDAWVRQAVGLLDALGIERTDLVGNLCGGVFAGAGHSHPRRVRRLVLMGRGRALPITPGWTPCGATPKSVENMSRHHGLLPSAHQAPDERRPGAPALWASIRPGVGILRRHVPRAAPASR